MFLFPLFANSSTRYKLGFLQLYGNVITHSVGGLGSFPIFSFVTFHQFIGTASLRLLKWISLSFYQGWLVSQCLWSLAGNVELSGNILLHKIHRASGKISSPMYVNPSEKWIIVLPFGLLSAVVGSLFKQPLFSHWSLINTTLISICFTIVQQPVGPRPPHYWGFMITPS